MKPWFQSRTVETVPADHAEDLLDTYKAGRVDEHRRLEHEHLERERLAPHVDKGDLKDAYERGRRDERARRRGSPLAVLLLVLVAVAGAGIMYLAMREGSFTGGGQVVDRNLSVAADKVAAPVRNAADNAGTALQNAGEGLKETAGSQDHR